MKKTFKVIITSIFFLIFSQNSFAETEKDEVQRDQKILFCGNYIIKYW
jgi:hypothetical protein